MRRIITLFLCAAAILFIAPLSACRETTAPNSCFLDLYYDSDAGIISGKAVYKFVNSSNEIMNKIKFNLYPNAYTEKNKAFFESYKDAYYQCESFGGIKILSCSSGENSSGNAPEKISVLPFRKMNLRSTSFAEIFFPAKRQKLQ